MLLLCTAKQSNKLSENKEFKKTCCWSSYVKQLPLLHLVKKMQQVLLLALKC